MKNVAVIGAGASGMMAAITAAGNKCNVTLFEKNDRVGKKILSTGNGKCNFTNALLGVDKYYCDDIDKVSLALSKFGNNDLISFFQRLGMLVKEKNGYYYPLSEQASTVLDVLRAEIDYLNIKTITGEEVISIDPNKYGFTLRTSANTNYKFDKVIVAGGGKSGLGKNESNCCYDILKSLGHSIRPLLPALTQIKASADKVSFPALKGVRVESVLSVLDEDEIITKSSGELLFTENGISGIVSFQLSHLIGLYELTKKTVAIEIDFMPGIDKADLEAFFCSKKLLSESSDLQSFMIGILNKKLNVELIKYCGLSPSMPINNMKEEDYNRIIDAIKHFRINCNGVNDFSSSQVTAGGIPLEELDDNFQSRIIKGLYIVGELTDVDGLCGGYNLQWAFTSGHIAGENACL